MALRPVASLLFVDADSDDEVYAGVRGDEGQVSLSLSRKSDGDVEVFLKADQCEQLIQALQQALVIARPG